MVRRQGVSPAVSRSTILRWLREDALQPWRFRHWIFPRDPDFAAKAHRILDLYQRIWEDEPLGEDDFVLSSDEKTSIQARRRCHPTRPPAPGRSGRIEHEYVRCGAWAYLAALDVHRMRLFGRCEQRTGIAPFNRLVRQVMDEHPYREARRVFWIVDNGPSHRGQSSIDRLQAIDSRIVLVHGPVHASWLNQIEIYFSVLQRKVLSPNDFRSLQQLRETILEFQSHYEQTAKPFAWRFTRQDLSRILGRLPRAA
jgi:hypothetical protein